MPVHAQAPASDLRLAGRKVPVMALTALPAAVIAMSAVTTAPKLSGIIAGLWLTLLPLSLYKRWAALALPFVAGAFLVFTVLVLPFNSAAFVVDFWTSVLMLILALPHR